MLGFVVISWHWSHVNFEHVAFLWSMRLVGLVVVGLGDLVSLANIGYA